MENKLKQEIERDLLATTAQLLETINLFSDEEFNLAPFEGSWTAGQVAEHLYKSESGIPQLFAGILSKTTRPTGQHVESIKHTFLDFSTKMKSPEFILPSNDFKIRDDYYSKFKTNRKLIIKIADEVDLSATLEAFELPGVGTMTGYEWLIFVICHSKRHIRQMQNIYRGLKEKVTP